MDKERKWISKWKFPWLFNWMATFIYLSLCPNSFTRSEHLQLEKITISSRFKRVSCAAVFSYDSMYLCKQIRHSAVSSLNPACVCQTCSQTHTPISLYQVYKTHVSFRITLIWNKMLDNIKHILIYSSEKWFWHKPLPRRSSLSKSVWHESWWTTF